MKKLLIILLITTGCASQKYLPDKQVQLTLIKAYRETKNNACGMPHNLRTWHIDLLTKDGDTIQHHYFTESFAKQMWLIPGDKYTLKYQTDDCGKYKYIPAILKHNN